LQRTRRQSLRSFLLAAELDIVSRHIVKRLFVLALAALLPLWHPAFAAGPEPSAVAGCYALKLGPWEPSLALGSEEVFTTPPAHIELRASKGTDRWAKGYFVLAPARGATALHRGLFWHFGAGGTVQLTFTTGYSGLTMSLARAGLNLRGTARSFWDAPRTEQTASVMATRESCQPR